MSIESKKYKVKISYPFLIVVCSVIVLPGIVGSIPSDGGTNSWVLNGILLATLAMVLFLFLRNEYLVKGNKLVVKCGFLKFGNIDISTIKKIEPTKSLMSSPAPSFDRILITYGQFDEIIISPENKVAFAADLKKLNKNIDISAIS